MKIKSWFLTKNFNQQEIYQINLAEAGGELDVINETEKAYRFAATTDFGTFRFWCPKSCVISDEELAAQEKKLDEAFKRGLDYNQKLLQLAKDAGLKVRRGMRTVTIIAALTAAGIAVPEKA